MFVNTEICSYLSPFSLVLCSDTEEINRFTGRTTQVVFPLPLLPGSQTATTGSFGEKPLLLKVVYKRKIPCWMTVKDSGSSYHTDPVSRGQHVHTTVTTESPPQTSPRLVWTVQSCVSIFKPSLNFKPILTSSIQNSYFFKFRIITLISEIQKKKKKGAKLWQKKWPFWEIQSKI